MLHITNEHLSLDQSISKAIDAAGAMVVFHGMVRNHNVGKGVKGLEYESYISMADKMIGAIIEDAKKKWGLHDALCVHRVGKVNVGESAVMVITWASHRNEAYEGNRYILDRVKYEVPIWKRELFEDGEIVWGKIVSKSLNTFSMLFSVNFKAFNRV